jgi:general secretion pathway protein D
MIMKTRIVGQAPRLPGKNAAGGAPALQLQRQGALTSRIDILHLIIPIVALSIFASGLFAQSLERITEREIHRRQTALSQGQAALVRAHSAMEERNFAAAHEEYRNAIALLPDGAISDGAHNKAIRGFCESGVKLAEQRIAEGKYSEAEFLAREVLDPRYDPNYRPAAELLAKLQKPGYFNQTMGPKFVAKVEEVKKLLTEADGYYKMGRYDLAFKKYDQVLALDPYNTAARKGQEEINLTRYQYNQQAYNETRSRQLWQVEKSWEEPVRRYGETTAGVMESIQRDAAGTARITQKLNSIIIPKIEFRDASIREAIDFLRQQAAANDPATEGRKGVDIVLRLAPLGQIAPPSTPVEPASAAEAPAGSPATGGTPIAAPPIVEPARVAAPAISPGNARITITLNQIPLGEALRYIASQAGLKVKVEPYAVLIIPISEQSIDLITKEYKVPPGFISATVNIGPSALTKGAYQTAPGTGTTGTGKDTEESTGGHQLVMREGAKEFLESQGVPFPAGASANFLPQSSRLIVRNTADNLELVDALVEQAAVAGPKQVEIESKFIEITQTNLKELGFDWLLGPFNIGNHKVFGSGGTVDNGSVGTFPLIDANGNPVGNTGTAIKNFNQVVGTGGGPVTAGNRSGSAAISANALDALLFPGNIGAAPGIFGLAGLFTDPQFQVVIRALSQKKGVDLLSAPRLTTKSGQRAIIEVVREFRYPTRFTPPQLPNISVSGGGSGSANIPAIAAPSTPSDFETRNTGVTLEVEPVVGPDGVTIDLNLVPQVVEFEGFINYGSPINAIAINTTAGISISRPVPITDNVINQPIFSSRKVTTSVSVWDGQTVVLGGLIREDVQKVEDRTPIVGDLPLVGRLFRSNVDQHVKRNLIIFVTAHLVTPGGQLVNAGEEEEEGPEQIEPPVLPEIPAYKK